MTTLTLSLILVTLTTTALSALIGDQLGRKIGKKKWSVFHLRPKYTSTVLTVLLSMALGLSVLGSLLLVSPTARLALLMPEQILASSQEAHGQHLAQINRSLQRFQHRHNQPSSAPLGWERDLTEGDFQLSSRQTLPAWKMPVMRQLARDTMPEPTLALHPTRSHVQIQVAANNDQDEPFRQALLANNQPIPQTYWVAQTGDVLATLDIPGTKSPALATAIVQEALRLADRYAQELGAENQNGAFIQVANGIVPHVQQSLGSAQAFTLHITVAHRTTRESPLPITLTLVPKSAPMIDPHDILERERLTASTNPQRLEMAFDEVIAATVKHMQARQQPVADFPQSNMAQSGFQAPNLDAIFTAAPVRFTSLTQRQFTLVGQLVAD